MNEQHPTFDANSADLDDHLMDRALAEIVGGDAPPDLTARIIDQVAAHQPEPATTSRRSLAAVGWSILTIAASVSIVATAVLMFGDRSMQRSASVSSVSMERSSIAKSKQQRKSSIGVRGLINEAHRPWESGGEGRGGDKGIVPTDQKPAGRLIAEGESTQLIPQTSTRAPASEIGDPEVEQELQRRHQEQLEGLTSKSSQSLRIDWSKVKPEERSHLYMEIYGQSKTDAELNMLAYRDATRAGTMKRGRSRNSVRNQSAELTTAVPLGERGGQMLVTPRIIIEEEAESISIVEAKATELGTGPGTSGDQYTRIVENPFVKAIGGDAVSTFSIDVDTASYANVRQFLMDMRQLPPPDAVRIEELVNYFEYDYEPPQLDSDPSDGLINDPAPFAAHVEVAGCPWAPEHRLVRIGIKGREIARDKRPKSNLVFLVDVSGSMDEPNKLPLVISGLRQLTKELGENDRVAIVVYASSEGLALESTRGDQQPAILAALDRLQAGGSTAGGAGIQLAYQIAEDHFIPGGTNRVVLCTDGDFNVGVTSTAELERLVAQKAKDTKVFLSVLGFGRGNLNDAMMQTIADRGNGNHHYVDNLREARKVLVEEMTSTLITIAKDVKIQVEFNPAQVAAYRLIGYENRLLRTEDFNDDRKDAGEIGAGHTITALYEVIPAGKPVDLPAVDELKYQPASPSNAKANEEKATSDRDGSSAAEASHELLTLKMRYQEPEGDVSRKVEWPITDAGTVFQDASTDFQFAAAVAGFGLILRGSEYRGEATLDAVAEIVEGALGKDEHGYRAEFIELVRQAKSLLPAVGSHQDASNQKE